MLLGYGPGQSALQSAKLASNCMYMFGCKLSKQIKHVQDELRSRSNKLQITNSSKLIARDHAGQEEWKWPTNVTGPLSRETAKLQAYAPTIRQMSRISQ